MRARVVMSVRVEREGAITTIAISRPHVRNAVDRETAAGLAEAFRTFDADPSQSVAILAGDGGTFCAGADLKAVASGRGNVTDGPDAPMGVSRLLVSKPVIAAVSGYAVGGGFELAIWCDLRVVEDDVVFGFFNRRYGVPLIDGGAVRLPRLIGLSRAMDLILTGREVRAAEAFAMGLANRVVPKGRALPEAQALARTLAAFPQRALRGDRMAALDSAGLSQEEALALETRLGSAAVHHEAVEGAKRFTRGER